MPNRSGKFYRRNEEEVMERLGLEPTYNSGSGWIEKEDGQNEQLICQLKSTDANSIKVNKRDLDVLEHNASVAHKVPVFAIQFLSSGEVYMICKPENLSIVSEFIESGVATKVESAFDEFATHDSVARNEKGKVVKSSKSAREKFMKENEKKWKKK